MLLGTYTPASAQLSIGINVSLYPDLVRVPGYPVYYAPQLDSNFFFYDRLYWVYEQDNWYSSSWYDGPWDRVAPEFVPLFVLRVPVRYYRQPPSYFRGWGLEAPPRWGEHWGRDWERRRCQRTGASTQETATPVSISNWRSGTRTIITGMARRSSTSSTNSRLASGP